LVVGTQYLLSQESVAKLGRYFRLLIVNLAVGHSSKTLIGRHDAMIGVAQDVRSELL
jgi:hypothetical protein